jgi:predicted transposase YbfD/YdcC
MHKATAPIQDFFGEIEDPRVEYLFDHDLTEIIVIAICAVICGANDWVAIETWARTKEKWLKQFLPLKKGIPSHHTFRRVFALIKPEEFQKAFLEWVQSVFTVIGGQVVALDGKEMHGSKSKTLGKKAITMVSAWATANHLVLGQRTVEEKSNEITAIPKLLELLQVQGCLVTIDAMGCQTKIAEQIIEQGGDYLLAVKENQGHLYQDIEFVFRNAERCEYKGIEADYAQEVSKGHGRIENRECWMIDDEHELSFLRNRSEWRSLKAIVLIRSHRHDGTKLSVKDRYFITSDNSSAAKLLEAKRAHWGIENGLHWVLDVAFREDNHQLETNNGLANFAVLRHIALNLLKQEKSGRHSVATKRLKAGWDESYLLQVLQAT